MIILRISWNKHVAFMGEPRSADEPCKRKYILEYVNWTQTKFSGSLL
jgi:hypothetical protein